MNSSPLSSVNFFQSKRAPYYIVSPNYVQQSSGPRMLYSLCHVLNELGYEAYITANFVNPWLRTPPLTEEVRRKHRETERTPIIVYPEVVKDNPLAGKVVARWILNKAGHLGGNSEFSSEELLFYWDEWVLKSENNADRLFLPSVDSRIFNSTDVREDERSGFCYYAHKYLGFGGTISQDLRANGISLCQDIPRSADEIAAILRQTKVLFCYEPSNMVAEAYACGCPTILVETDYLKQFDLSRFDLPKISCEKINISAVSSIPESYSEMVEADNALSLQTVMQFIEKTQKAALAHNERAKTSAYRLDAAIEAFQRNDHVESSKIFTSLVNGPLDSALPFAYLAFICAGQGMFEEADDFLERALKIAPSRIDLKAGLGESLLKAGHPAQAVRYLKEAITVQPDLLAAYPALAQSLHLTGRTDEAIALLQAVIAMPEAARSHIPSVLLELLAQQGNLDGFASICLRYSQGLADDLLAARCLARFDAEGERLLDALAAAQSRLPTCLPETLPPRPEDGRCRIAFMLSDFAREARQGRLEPLLSRLPAERFVTQLIINDPGMANNDFANACSLIADELLIIDQQNDAVALEQLKQLAPDVLIDLDSYGAADRLALLVQAAVPYKLLWGEIPLPPLSPDCQPLRGALLADDDLLPGVALPGLGEYLALPDLPIATNEPATPLDTKARHFACLTPAIRIGRDAWQLFATALAANEDSILSINLDELGECAQNYITALFEKAGVAASRLHFVHLDGLDDLCRFWQQADIGLAPPVDDGDAALATCLWMGKPFIALAAGLPWSRRPAVLLECAGAGQWIAETPEAFIELAQSPLPSPSLSFRKNLAAVGLNDPAAFAHGFASSITQLIQTPPAPQYD